MTRFYVRDLRDGFTARYRELSRSVYKRIVSAYSRLGVAFRVETTYEGGTPRKWFTALPTEPGSRDFTEHAHRLRIPLPPKV